MKKHYIKASGVYCIENTVTGKFYVGSSKNVELRIKEHLRFLRKGKHHSVKLQNSWNYHGEAAFQAGLIVACAVEELLAMEQEFIVSLNSVNEGYNAAKYAGAPMRGRKASDETKAKISAASKHRPPISEETRERLKVASVLREQKKKDEGHEVTQETRDKISASGKGRVVSDETKRKISVGNSGKIYTEEMRSNMSQAHLNRERTEAEIEGYKVTAEKNTGKVRSEEFKQRMSVIAKKRGLGRRSNA